LVLTANYSNRFRSNNIKDNLDISAHMFHRWFYQYADPAH